MTLIDYYLADPPEDEDGAPYPSKIDWVIAGGESGQKARASHANWFRVIRNACIDVGVPFFFKQWGEWGETDDHYRVGDALDEKVIWFEESGVSTRVGVKKSGSRLDGREWKQYPNFGEEVIECTHTGSG